MRLLLWLLLLVAVYGKQCQPIQPYDTYDNWNAIVSKYIQPGVLEGIPVHVVDYNSISLDSHLPAFLDQLSCTDPLQWKDKSAVLAFFINTYNALAINKIVQNPCIPNTCTPIQSIKNITNVWDDVAGVVGGMNVSLNDVESYLRNPLPWLEDSRIHSCIVCASISCPNVRTEAFVADKLESQLRDQMTDFLSNQKKGLVLDTTSNTLTLSHIFFWFYGDFTRSGTLVDFIAPYAPPDVQQYLASHPNVNVTFFDYDWDVNGIKPKCQC